MPIEPPDAIEVIELWHGDPPFRIEGVGPEVAYVFDFREKGSGSYDGNHTWATYQRDRADNRFDARLRAEATAWYHRVGFNASYSHGFINYRGGLMGGSPEAYARILRLGLAYRLR